MSWIPRECNKTADFLANVALQSQESYEWTQDVIDDAKQVIVMSDGGFVDGVGSAGWCIMVVTSSGKLDVIHCAYLYFQAARSPFECEMIGLCNALSKYCPILS